MTTRILKIGSEYSNIEEEIGHYQTGNVLPICTSKQKYNEEMVCDIWLEWDIGCWLKENVDHRGGDAVTLSHRDKNLPHDISKKQSSRWQLISWIPDESSAELAKYETWVDLPKSLINSLDLSISFRACACIGTQ